MSFSSGTSGSAGPISGQSDVALNNPLQDQVLSYDTSTSKWTNRTVSSTVSNATTSAAGVVQLAGDLGGTATSPTVPSLSSKANVADVYTKTQTDAALSAKANAADFTAATDVVTTSSLTSTLSPYAKTADVSSTYVKLSDYQNLVTRVSNLETAAGVTPSTRPTKPSTTAQPSFWLRSDQITASGSTISAWADNVNNVAYTVPSGRNAPTYNATGINNKPAAVFTKASTSGLFYAKPIKAESQTIFMVYSLSVLAAGQGLIQATDNTATATNLNVNTYSSSGNALVAGVLGNTNGNAFSSSQLSTANAGAVGRFSFGGSSGSAKALAVSLNGATETGGTSNTQAFTAAASTGFTVGGAGTTGADIMVAEVIIFDSLLSSADKVAWTQYLGSVYSITVGSN